ncbi:MAG: spore protease YyaC [Lachnospiraceae bacterium]
MITAYPAPCFPTSVHTSRIGASDNPDVLSPLRLRALLRDASRAASPVRYRHMPPVILCIGTDRIIGDCLGPLAGSMIKKAAGEHLPVYGTLEHTVHALNLSAISQEIKKKHHGQIMIAVDASLGSYEHIGSVFVRPGCLRPGAGVRKKLPGVGDIAITGIANGESSSPYLDLQTARLSTISRMAEMICDCILDACF